MEKQLCMPIKLQLEHAKTMDETEYRRCKQINFNTKHNIIRKR
jgi:excinuclease UvrABC helicase subunit UvrB